MKVVMSILRFKPAIGGGEEHVYQLSRKLVENGHEVVIFTSDLKTHYPKPTYLSKESIKESYDGLPVKRFHALCMIREYPILRGLTKSLLKEEFDIIHAHGYGYFTSDSSTLVSFLCKKPLVLTTHGFFPASTPVNPLSMEAYVVFSRFWLLKMVRKLICVSRADAIHYRKLVDSSRVAVIPNGIDIEYWSKLPKQGKFGAVFEPKGPVIVSVGRITQIKGYQYLIQATPRILREFPKAMIFIAGPDVGYLNYLRRLAHELRVNKHVVFTGPVVGEKKKELYVDADIVVVPSIDESFGIVALEAMACGKPVVAASVGGLSDIVKHGVNGLLVKPRNPSELAKAILTLLKKPALAIQMGYHGRTDVGKYSWSRVVECVEKIYHEALSDCKL
jgi:glycosyltransferase involved in cell wall biosynthesis